MAIKFTGGDTQPALTFDHLHLRALNFNQETDGPIQVKGSHIPYHWDSVNNVKTFQNLSLPLNIDNLAASVGAWLVTKGSTDPAAEIAAARTQLETDLQTPTAALYAYIYACTELGLGGILQEIAGNVPSSTPSNEA